jgi:predicted small metal-binding protein
MQEEKMEKIEKEISEIAEETINKVKQTIMKKLFGNDAVNIIRSSLSWNCFVEYEDGRVQFVTGGYWDYIYYLCASLYHLNCIIEKEIMEYEEIEKKIEEEWKEVTKN